MNYKIVEQVSRKKKSMSGVLRVVMIVFAVLFVVMGITISQVIYASGIYACRVCILSLIYSVRRIMNT